MSSEDACLAKFVRMCDDGWRLGWHEANGGNLSYRLTAGEDRALDALGACAQRPWEPLARPLPVLGGAQFLVTGSGAFMRNVALEPADAAGVVELDADGARWRVVRGLCGGRRPTSELACHLACYAAAPETTRVVYHAHTPNLVALTRLLPAEDGALTRVVWTSLTEGAIVMPHGVAVLPWMPPGSARLADATVAAIAPCGLEAEPPHPPRPASPRDLEAGPRHPLRPTLPRDLVVWALHGVLGVGVSFDQVFGRVHTAEKAAGIYLAARAANGGSDAFANALTTDDLIELDAAYSLGLDRDLLGCVAAAGE